VTRRICFDTREWFIETSFPGVRRAKKDGFRISREVFKGKSKFQDIYIFESPGFGKILTLDGIIQLSQSDEFIYHEMIAHVPLLTHRDPQRLLVIGGGDGGVLREATKHPLRQIHFVEIDKEIVRVSKKYLPFISKGAFNDRRLNIFFEDGRKFIQSNKDHYDAIIVDSTDPVGPGKVLFKLGFYRMVFDALKKEGVAIFQVGPFLDFDLIVKGIGSRLKSLFSFVTPVRLPMPSYSCGCEYCFILASKGIDPTKLSASQVGKRLKQRLKKKVASLRYYSAQIHQASMIMPKIWQL
jgi:spermidine synthase